MPLFDLGITTKEELTTLIKEDLVEKFDIIFKEECENIETWKNCKYSQSIKDNVKSDCINIFCELISKLTITRFYLDNKKITFNPKIVVIKNDLVSFPIFISRENIKIDEVSDFFNTMLLELMRSNIVTGLLSL